MHNGQGQKSNFFLMAEYIINSPSSSQVTVPAKDNHHIAQQKRRRDRSPEVSSGIEEIKKSEGRGQVDEYANGMIISPKLNKTPLVQLEARPVVKNKNQQHAENNDFKTPLPALEKQGSFLNDQSDSKIPRISRAPSVTDLKPVIVVTPNKSSTPVNLFIDDISAPQKSDHGPPQLESHTIAHSEVASDDDTLSIESGEINIPAHNIVLQEYFDHRLEKSVDGPSLTKAFLDVIHLYCDVLEQYPELMGQIDVLIAALSQKETRIINMEQSNNSLISRIHELQTQMRNALNENSMLKENLDLEVEAHKETVEKALLQKEQAKAESIKKEQEHQKIISELNGQMRSQRDDCLKEKQILLEAFHTEKQQLNDLFHSEKNALLEQFQMQERAFEDQMKLSQQAFEDMSEQYQRILDEKNSLYNTIAEQSISIQNLNETVLKRDHALQEIRSKIDPALEFQNAQLLFKVKQMGQQIRVLKIKAEQVIAESQSEINNKNIEIEVLKEMIKGIQIQLKSKEQDVIRLNKKVLQVEGLHLAQRLQQNITIFNNFRSNMDSMPMQSMAEQEFEKPRNLEQPQKLPPIQNPSQDSSLLLDEDLHKPLTQLKASPIRAPSAHRASSRTQLPKLISNTSSHNIQPENSKYSNISNLYTSRGTTNDSPTRAARNTLNKSASDASMPLSSSRLTKKVLKLHQKRLDEMSEVNRSSLSELMQYKEQYFSGGNQRQRRKPKNRDIGEILEQGREEEEPNQFIKNNLGPLQTFAPNNDIETNQTKTQNTIAQQNEPIQSIDTLTTAQQNTDQTLLEKSSY
ncbi:hypothetical protein FGO68_gene5901 [Halteria grandinella]|uniref:Uncharacterized protein n=1 Tax=Halteria grandinella TaxID=5974 RepID=A0A8J8NVP5_HALGN|nr:hypothetical protein FGO68_gene5901 [Halteria grandinella]